MKKKSISRSALLVLVILLGGHFNAIACEACKAQQSKFLQGIAHGSGPTSNWDYIIVSIMVIITVYSFYAMIKCLIKPADKTPEDIKNIILNS